MRQWRRATIALTWLALSAGHASAQPASVSSTALEPVDTANAARARSREDFARGVQLARQALWSEAERAFEASWAGSSTANCAFNLAVARYHLGRYAAAERALDDFAAAGGGDPAKQAEAQRLRQLLAPRLARVTLHVLPATAEVHVDGALQPGSGEWRALALDPGEHALQITNAGHAPAARSLRVSGAEVARLDVALERPVEPLRAPEPAQPQPRPTPASTGNGLRLASLAGGAVGAAAVVVSLGLGVAALQRNADSRDACDGNDCLPAGHDARTQARDLGNAASVLAVAGGVLLAGSLVLWLTTSPERRTQVAVRGGPDRLVLDVRGTL